MNAAIKRIVMNTTKRSRLPVIIAGALGVAAALTMGASAASPRFYEDDPIWQERDTEDASGMKPLEVDLIVDLTTNLLARSAAGDARAQNVNTLGEVPDSSWFTNRAGRRPLTPEDVFIGPDTTPGPEPGRWTVTSSKSDGVTPGFTIKDTRGQLWFLKFDPPGYRGMATGTEVAVTKLMWDVGLDVPVNNAPQIRRASLDSAIGARFRPREGGGLGG